MNETRKKGLVSEELQYYINMNSLKFTSEQIELIQRTLKLGKMQYFSFIFQLPQLFLPNKHHS